MWDGGRGWGRVDQSRQAVVKWTHKVQQESAGVQERSVARHSQRLRYLPCRFYPLQLYVGWVHAFPDKLG